MSFLKISTQQILLIFCFVQGTSFPVMSQEARSKQADCLKDYEREMDKAHLFNKKSEYKKVYIALTHDQGPHNKYYQATDEVLFGHFMDDVKNSGYREPYRFLDIISKANKKRILCEGDKPLKGPALIASIGEIEKRIVEDERNETYALKNKFLRSLGKEPGEVSLKALMDAAEEFLPENQQLFAKEFVNQEENFLKLRPRPDLHQMLRLPELDKVNYRPGSQKLFNYLKLIVGNQLVLSAENIAEFFFNTSFINKEMVSKLIDDKSLIGLDLKPLLNYVLIMAIKKVVNPKSFLEFLGQRLANPQGIRSEDFLAMMGELNDIDFFLPYLKIYLGKLKKDGFGDFLKFLGQLKNHKSYSKKAESFLLNAIEGIVKDLDSEKLLQLSDYLITEMKACETSLAVRYLALQNAKSHHYEDVNEIFFVDDGRYASCKDQFEDFFFINLMDTVSNQSDLEDMISYKKIHRQRYDDLGGSYKELQRLINRKMIDLKQEEHEKTLVALDQEVRKKVFVSSDSEELCDHPFTEYSGDEDQETILELRQKYNIQALYQGVSSLVKNEADEDCYICTETVPCQQGVKCSHCLVNFCKSCYQNGFNLQLKEKRFPLTCTKCKKETVLTHQDFQDLQLEDKEKSVRDATLLAHHKLIYPQGKNCPTPDCLNRLLPDQCDANKHIKCRSCKQKTCFDCQERHPGKTCKDHLSFKKGDNAFQELLDKGDIRLCFNEKCKSPIEKNEGCNRIRCEKCGKDNFWDPSTKVLVEWKGYQHHNATGDTWKGVDRNKKKE